MPFLTVKQSLSLHVAAYKYELTDVYFHNVSVLTSNEDLIQIIDKNTQILLLNTNSKRRCVRKINEAKYLKQYNYNKEYFHLLGHIREYIAHLKSDEINYACEAYLNEKQVSDPKIHNLIEQY